MTAAPEQDPVVEAFLADVERMPRRVADISVEGSTRVWQ